MLTGQIDELGVSYLNRALDLAEKIDDVPGQIRLIGRLHLLQVLTANYDNALSTARRGEAIAHGSGDSVSVARMRVLLGISCHYLGDVAAARSYIEAALSHSGLEDDVRSGARSYPLASGISGSVHGNGAPSHLRRDCDEPSDHALQSGALGIRRLFLEWGPQGV
jgi:hypothetical protein